MSNYNLSDCAFRVARADDLEDIYFLIESNMENFRSKKALRDELSSPNYLNYLLLVNGSIVGICNFFLMIDFVDLNLILIDEKYRGCGYGRLLLELSLNNLKKVIRHRAKQEAEFEELCGDNRTTETKSDLFLNLEVSVLNNTAIALYKSFGFQELSIRKDYYAKGVDAIFMRCLLN